MEGSHQSSMTTCHSMALEALRILKTDSFPQRNKRDHVSDLHLLPSAKVLALPWNTEKAADQLSREEKFYLLVEDTIIRKGMHKSHHT